MWSMTQRPRARIVFLPWNDPPYRMAGSRIGMIIDATGVRCRAREQVTAVWTRTDDYTELNLISDRSPKSSIR